MEETNAFRRVEHLVPVAREAHLEAAAREFAVFMARTGKFDHDADGRTPSERARAHGYDICLIAENIAYEYSSADFHTEDLARRFVQGWKDSPGHRRNMLKAGATDIGVAVARSNANGAPRYYAVQLFGRPRSAAIEFRVVNSSGVAVRYRVADRAFVLEPRQVRTHRECTHETLAFSLRGANEFTPRGGERFVVDNRGQTSVRYR